MVHCFGALRVDQHFTFTAAVLLWSVPLFYVCYVLLCGNTMCLRCTHVCAAYKRDYSTVIEFELSGLMMLGQVVDHL